MCCLLGVKRNNFYSYQKYSVNKAVDPDHDEIMSYSLEWQKQMIRPNREKRRLVGKSDPIDA